jgi:hypothetical protein
MNPQPTIEDGTFTEEGFVFSNVWLVDPEGTPFAVYDRVVIPSESVKNRDGEEITQTWGRWDADYTKYNHKDKLWLNFPLFYHALEWAWKNQDKPEAQQIKESFRQDYDMNGFLMSGTKLVYNFHFMLDNIIHKVGCEGKEVSLDTKIPRLKEKTDLKELLDCPEIRKWTNDLQRFTGNRMYGHISEMESVARALGINFLQSLTGKQDVTNVAAVLDWAGDKDTFLLTIGSESSVSGPRPAMAGVSYTDHFFIGCDDHSNYSSRTRAADIST